MREFCAACLDAAALAGASYADVRVTDTETQSIKVRNGALEGIESGASFGFGVRVIADGAWGFAASNDTSNESAVRVARQAVAIARASATIGDHTVELSPLEGREGRWAGPWVVDPFAVGLDEKLGLLLDADRAMRAVEGVALAESELSFLHERKWFASTDGSFLEQSHTESSAGIVAYAIEGGEVFPRSYPNSHGGGSYQGGWEAILALDLVGNATRIAEQAVALLSAPECPSTTTTLVLDGSQLGLQVHESVGHPTELDRVLGDEAAFAGTSWVAAADIGTLRYGADIVNITADATVPGSLGSFGWDDEGVEAQRDHLVKDGILTSVLSSRESAAAIGRSSNGCMRADGWNRTPLIRMTTVSLEPGEAGSFEDLIADTEDGLYFETNNSWSIDDKRLNFQFGCEIAWEIKGGELGRIMRHPNYTGITPRFWAACDAICSRDAWQVWGLANCGKGEPMQVAHVAHGAAPARFRDVQVGVGR
ncbi:MAG: TldD/PmbA family protein [Coriobacteriia bacterium]|nr:TldD/PmbA family protein [Coriobacteriia bacterium]